MDREDFGDAGMGGAILTPAEERLLETLKQRQNAKSLPVINPNTEEQGTQSPTSDKRQRIIKGGSRKLLKRFGDVVGVREVLAPPCCQRVKGESTEGYYAEQDVSVKEVHERTDVLPSRVLQMVLAGKEECELPPLETVWNGLEDLSWTDVKELLLAPNLRILVANGVATGLSLPLPPQQDFEGHDQNKSEMNNFYVDGIKLEDDEQLRIYLNKVNTLESRSDPRNPARFLTTVRAARMTQLIECFPNGITVDCFIDAFQKKFKYQFEFGGYNFPFDTEEDDSFKFDQFWIPGDCFEFGLRSKLLFPVQTKQRFHGSLAGVLHHLWHEFRKFFKRHTIVQVDDVFDLDEDGMYRLTGIRVSPKLWSLVGGYVELVRILHDYFDGGGMEFVMVDAPYYDDEDGGLFKEAWFVMRSDFRLAPVLRKIFLSLMLRRENDKKKVAKVPVQQRPAIHAEYTDLKQEHAEALKDGLIGHVCIAGGVTHFYTFFVLLLRDLGRQEVLLKVIDEYFTESIAQRVNGPPEEIQVNMLVGYKHDELGGIWRRAIVTKYDMDADWVTMLDVDTGEVHKRPRTKLLRILREVIDLPVHAIPCTFGVGGPDLFKRAVGGEGDTIDEVIGRSLQLALNDVEFGMTVKFHEFIPFYDYYRFWTKGAWLITGFRVDLLYLTPIRPTLALGNYLVRHYASGRLYKKYLKTYDIPEHRLWEEIPTFQTRPVDARRKLVEMWEDMKLIGSKNSHKKVKAKTIAWFESVQEARNKNERLVIDEGEVDEDTDRILHTHPRMNRQELTGIKKNQTCRVVLNFDQGSPKVVRKNSSQGEFIPRQTLPHSGNVFQTQPMTWRKRVDKKQDAATPTLTSPRYFILSRNSSRLPYSVLKSGAIMRLQKSCLVLWKA